MKQNARTVVVALAGLMLVGSLSACGDDTESAVETDTETTAASGTDTTEASSNSSSGIAYQLVDTGQTSSYDADGNEIDEPAAGEALSGQDGAYEGAQMSYTDNGDGTVTDNVTELIWEQDPTETSTVFDDAVAYCDALELGGSDDWRIPSLKELFSISDFSEGWPYLDTDYFFLVESARQDKDQQFWAQHYEVDTDEAVASSAFGVNHMTGHIKAYPDGSDGNQMAAKYVRCVSGDDYGVNAFVTNGDGTVTDAATGLMWSQDDSGEGLDWESALDLAVLANEENYLGYSDWRVPNVKELQSIVDYSGVYPAIDEGVFNITDEDAYFWTSTSAYFSAQNPDYYYAWYVAFGYAVDGEGNDSHGAGAVRFDTKVDGGPAGEDPERIYNYVRLVRDA